MMTWKFRSSYWRKLHKPGETKALDRRNYAICWTDYKDMAVIVTWAVYGLPEFKVRGNSNYRAANITRIIPNSTRSDTVQQEED